MWIARDWTAPLAAMARSFPAVLVTGPRQVGKTFLLRRHYPDHGYATFDDPALARQADSQPELFFDTRPEPLILDEVQYVPSIFRRLKQRIDSDRTPGRFLLTGSQSFSLMENVSESLAGRCGILEMSSLAYREASRAVSDLSDLDFLVRGGFPELFSGTVVRPSDWYVSYVATYLERDVRNVRQVGNLRDFDRFLRATAIRSGQILSFSDLARDVGVSPNTARAWISVLQASGQILLLEPYHRNLGKRLVKSPKLYFLDTGLVCHLVGITDRAGLVGSPLAGALWETFVVGQVVRHFQVAGVRPPLWFWRTSQGEEVDLLVERGGRFIAIECKLTETPGSGMARGLAALTAYYGEHSVERAFVACRTPHMFGLGTAPEILAVGIQDLVAQLPGN